MGQTNNDCRFLIENPELEDRVQERPFQSSHKGAAGSSDNEQKAPQARWKAHRHTVKATTCHTRRRQTEDPLREKERAWARVSLRIHSIPFHPVPFHMSHVREQCGHVRARQSVNACVRQCARACVVARSRCACCVGWGSSCCVPQARPSEDGPPTPQGTAAPTTPRSHTHTLHRTVNHSHRPGGSG